MTFYENEYPRQSGDSKFIYNASIRAKACDVARGLLPASTYSNVGIFATGQAYEQLLIRMNSHPLEEVREYAQKMLVELRKVIPSFMKRVDLPNRGGAWSRYLKENHDAVERIASSIDADPDPTPEVSLVEWDSDAEKKIVAAALYAHTQLSDVQLQSVVDCMSDSEKTEVIKSYVCLLYTSPSPRD